MADHITTYGGTHFTPTSPDINKIHIKDIAHALSLTCRGNGHVKTFFPSDSTAFTVHLKPKPEGIPGESSLPVLYMMQVRPICQMFRRLSKNI